MFYEPVLEDPRPRFDAPVFREPERDALLMPELPVAVVERLAERNESECLDWVRIWSRRQPCLRWNCYIP